MREEHLDCKEVEGNAYYPSAIVNDFRSYLNYITTRKLKLTKASAHFTRRDLQALYVQMEESQPEVDPKMSQPGYPLLHLFYHLSVELDFIKVARTPSTARAAVNEERIKEFLAINRAEQYVSLLHSFWQRTDWEVLQGEKWARVPASFSMLYDELAELPPEEKLELRDHKDLSFMLREYGHFFYYFSYFGFWAFEVDESKSMGDQGWPRRTFPKTITLTHFYKKIDKAL
jgi:uncharacterized protein (DUF952 family)